MEGGGDGRDDLYRFELERTLGLINSPLSNCLYHSDGKRALVGALNTVYVWNIRTGQVAQKWTDPGCQAEVSVLCASPRDSNLFAAGYTDGSVRLWRLGEEDAGTLELVFSGHKNAVTVLAFDATGGLLASGARDNDIVVWDLISESGLYRLCGHGNAVTGLAFTAQGKALVSASKDGLLKVWDLATRHCVETCVQHTGEICCLVVFPDRNRLCTMGVDNKLYLFALSEDTIAAKLNGQETADGAEDNACILRLIETVHRSSNERAMHAIIGGGSEQQQYLACLGTDRSLEIWQVLGEEQYQKKQKQREQKEPKKTLSWLKQLRYTRLQSKARSVEFTPGWKIRTKDSLRMLVGFTDNQLAELVVPLERTAELSIPVAVDGLGHRTECRSVAINAEGTLLASASREELKIWKVDSGSLVRSVEVQEPSVLDFVPGSERCLLVGDLSGALHLIDYVDGEFIDSVQAHVGGVKALALRPDRRGFMSGGADKSIKFWEFKSRSAANGAASGLRLKMIKTLQMNDEVLCLKYSPDLRYIAVATMDMTVKVFFEDSLRFYLSLYGHKLPVTDMDISGDGKVLISASADKNVKIWSLEFGECRRSLFAHQEAVTSVAFVPGTRRFLSCSKDKTIKYWDAVKFTDLQKLSVHHGEVWALRMAQGGGGDVRFVTVSKDRTIRIWRASEEPLFPEEERELALESQIDRSLVEDNPHEREGGREETGRASTKTLSNMKTGERIMECIEAADDERRKWDEYRLAKAQNIPITEPTPGALYLALGGADKTPAEVVLAAFERIPLPDVEEALLCLPMNVLPSLLYYVRCWLEGRRNVVMSSRILDTILHLFHASIIATPSLRSLLEEIRDLERQTLEQLRQVIGYNNAALKMLSVAQG